MYHSNLANILENDKYYEDKAAKSSASHTTTMKALDFVKNYIKRKKLIIYGGMAIDFALKYSGHEGIYKPDTIPDYDFISSDAYNDSNELADLLVKEGFENVSTVNAIHVTTRKVRVNFEWVADITYFPKNIVDKLPYLVYDGLRFVHPNFQRMDMHIELCYPYDNPPWEVLLHRTRKTIKRFKLMNEIHPLSASNKQIDAYKKKLKLLTIDKKMLMEYDGKIIDGYLSYVFLHSIVKNMINPKSKIGAILYKSNALTSEVNKMFSELVDPNLEIKEDSITFMNNNSTFHVLSIDPNLNKEMDEKMNDKKDNKKEKIEKYNKYLDYTRPPMFLIKDKLPIEIYDISTKQIPCFELSKCLKIGEIPNTFLNFKLPIFHMTMLYYLQKYHEEKDDSYLVMYTQCFNLHSIYETVLSNFIDVIGENFQMKKIIDEIYKLPFFLSPYVCNDKSFKDAYEIFLISSEYMINGTPKESQETLRPPMIYNPSENKKAPEFNPSDSRFFSIDGKLIK